MAGGSRLLRREAVCRYHWVMDINGDETATQALHRLTSYDPDHAWDSVKDDPRLLQDFEPNDFSRWPLFTKRYADADALPRTPLPRDLPTITSPALAVLAGTAQTAPAPLDLAGLSRVLHLSAGVVRVLKREAGTHLFRAAGSAGGRFPLELYVAVPEGTPGLPPGVHWYDPEDHALVQVGPAPRQDEDAARPLAPTIVVT